MWADLSQSEAEEIPARLAIASAANVSPYYNQTTVPGSGWVSLQRSEADDTGFGFMDRWAVTIVLPQDLAAAERWIEQMRDTLVANLKPVLIVTALVPATLTLGGGSVPALVIEGTRPH